MYFYYANINPSTKEILHCWKNGISFRYKDSRIKDDSYFIQANPDGSEDLVQLVVDNSKYASDVTFNVIKRLHKSKQGKLYNSIYSRIKRPCVCKKKISGEGTSSSHYKRKYARSTKSTPINIRNNNDLVYLRLNKILA